MKRKLIRIFIIVVSVMAISGGELNAGGHQHLVKEFGIELKLEIHCLVLRVVIMLTGKTSSE